MLEGFTAPFNATVVDRLETAGIHITCRAKASEFGTAGLFEKQGDGSPALCGSDDRKTRGRSPCLKTGDGSLSYGIVDHIAEGKADFALCNDFSGVISRAAAAQDLYYIHPTYGSVSRYGLIPAVTSMDQIGIVCKDPDVGFHVLNIITGYDSRDGVMEKREKDWIASCARNDEDTGTVPLSSSKIYPQIMQILCSAELSNNISRYDGIKFGHRAKGYSGLQELYTKSRTEAFGEDVKLAAIIGAMVLSQENYSRYYDKAMRLRRLIKNSLDFDKYNVIVTKCPILSRLCGLPSLTTPEKVYIADAGREDILEAISKGVNNDEGIAGDAI